MTPAYPIIDVTHWPVETPEQMGAKEKDWRTDPQTNRWLWKLCRTDARTGVYAGEDWSEKVAGEIAQILGLPHAVVELAERSGQRGVIVRDFVPDPKTWQMTHGNEALAKIIDNYPRDQIRGLSLHTIENVFNVLTDPNVHAPSNIASPVGVTTATDVFVGYLMLDALIGNGDRHHQNWAVLERQDAFGEERYAELAPTYDHASSLGRELTDQGRSDGLSGRKPSRSPMGYMQRCRSAFYLKPTDPDPLSPLDAFRTAGHARPIAAKAWVTQLNDTPLSALEPVLAAAPAERMSAIARQFVLEMLRFNRDSLVKCEF